MYVSLYPYVMPLTLIAFSCRHPEYRLRFLIGFSAGKTMLISLRIQFAALAAGSELVRFCKAIITAADGQMSAASQCVARVGLLPPANLMNKMGNGVTHEFIIIV